MVLARPLINYSSSLLTKLLGILLTLPIIISFTVIFLFSCFFVLWEGLTTRRSFRSRWLSFWVLRAPLFTIFFLLSLGFVLWTKLGDPFVRGSLSFQTFSVWELLLILHTKTPSPLRSNLLWVQCTSSAVPTTSGRLNGSLLMWACQWPSSQPLSSPQMYHNDSLWA